MISKARQHVWHGGVRERERSRRVRCVINILHGTRLSAASVLMLWGCVVGPEFSSCCMDLEESLRERIVSNPNALICSAGGAVYHSVDGMLSGSVLSWHSSGLAGCYDCEGVTVVVGIRADARGW